MSSITWSNVKKLAMATNPGITNVGEIVDWLQKNAFQVEVSPNKSGGDPYVNKFRALKI